MNVLALQAAHLKDALSAIRVKEGLVATVMRCPEDGN